MSGPAAISVPPSENWIGNTGPWSSFQLQIGVPAQAVEILAATSKTNIWPILPDYCDYLSAVGDCATFRGGLYNPDNSRNFNTPLSDDPPYTELPFKSEEPLGYNGTASFGTDVVGIGGAEDEGQVLENQALMAFAYTSPWMASGLLGLNNNSLVVEGAPGNFSSPLTTLRETSRIPSLFWGYNAGARYLYPPPFASLTLGGYDAIRAGDLEDALKVPMQKNNFRDLVVTIDSISIGSGDAHVPASTINAFIDSVVPDIWLPPEDCKVFEDAFGLQWNETAQMYLLDDEQRDNLYRDNTAKINFTISDPADTGNSVGISFAYAAFDLEARYPLAGIEDGSSRHYFPLKRANDSSQYYLGHTFLQEA